MSELDEIDFSDRYEKKAKKRIIISLILAGVVLMCVLLPISLNSFENNVLVNKKGNLNPSEEVYYRIYTPRFAKDYFPLLIESNRIDYINNLDIINDGDYLSYEQTDFFQNISNTIAYSYNELLESNSDNFILNSTTYNSSHIRLFFDISNYTLEDFFQYRINLNILNIQGTDIEINAIQNIESTEIVLSIDIFHDIFDYSEIIDPFDKKNLDISLYFNSSKYFSINLTCYVEIIKDFNEEHKFYIVQNNQNVVSNYDLYLEFNETLEINGTYCDSLMISKYIITDIDYPSLSYQLSLGNLQYSISDSNKFYFTFNIYYDNNFYTFDLTEPSFNISIKDSISYFRGIFVVFDEAGNLMIQSIKYNKSLYEIDEEINENNQNNEKKTSSFDQFFLFFPLLLVLVVACLFVLNSLYLLFNNKRVEKFDLEEPPIKKFQIFEKLKSKYIISRSQRKENAIIIEKRKRSVYFDHILSSLGIAVVQGFLFLCIIYVLERGNLIGLKILDFNSNLIYVGELALIFGLIFCISDLFAEIIRSNLTKVFREIRPQTLLILVVIVSFIQFTVLITILEILSNVGVMTVSLFDFQNRLISPASYYLFFAVIIFGIEIFIELIRRRLQGME